MQWDPSPGGGFSTATPWLPLVDPATRNVADQAADPASMLALYRRLIALRAASPAVAHGTHRSLFGVAPDVLAWLREADGERVLVLLNVGDTARPCSLGRVDATSGEVLVATSARTGAVDLGGLQLDPLEGLVLRL